MFALRGRRIERSLGGSHERRVLVGREIRNERPVREGREPRDDVEPWRARLDDDRVRPIGDIAARAGHRSRGVVGWDQGHRTLRDRNRVHRGPVRHVERALELHHRGDRSIGTSLTECLADRAHRAFEHA